MGKYTGLKVYAMIELELGKFADENKTWTNFEKYLDKRLKKARDDLLKQAMIKVSLRNIGT